MSASAEPLRVTVTRTGGVAGLRRAWSLDAGALPPPLAAELRHLVADAEARVAAGDRAATEADTEADGRTVLPPAATPDAFRYRVTVRHGERDRQLADLAGSPGVPPGSGVRRLVDLVLAHGRAVPPGTL